MKPLVFVIEKYRLFKSNIYLTNTLWLLCERILKLSAGLFVGIYLARYVGVESFGVYNYVLSIVSIFSAIARLGMENIVVFEILKAEDKATEIIGTSFWLKLCAAVIIFILEFCYFDLLNTFGMSSQEKGLILIASCCLFFQSFEVLDYFFQAKSKLKYVSLAKIGQLLVTTSFQLWVIFSGEELIWIIIIYVIDQFIFAIILLFYYIRGWPNFIRIFDKGLAISLLSTAWPAMMINVFTIVQSRIDQVILERTTTFEVIGNYSAVISLVAVFDFVGVIVQKSVYPLATTLYLNKSHAIYSDFMLNYYRAMFILFLLVFIPLVLFGEQTVLFLYGSEFEDAAHLLKFVAVRLLFSFFGVAKSTIIVNANLFRFNLILSVIGAVLNIICNLILIPKLGVYGCIISSMVSFLVCQHLLDVVTKRTREDLILRGLAIVTFYKASFSKFMLK